MDKYGFRVVYDASCVIGPKLSSIIRDGEWYWPSARSDQIVEIQSRLPEMVIGSKDLPVWNTNKGNYSSADTLEHSVAEPGLWVRGVKNFQCPVFFQFSNPFNNK